MSTYGQFCPVARRWSTRRTLDPAGGARIAEGQHPFQRPAPRCRRCHPRCCPSAKTLTRAGLVERTGIDGRTSTLTGVRPELVGGGRAGRLGRAVDRQPRRRRPGSAPADVGHPANHPDRQLAPGGPRWPSSSTTRGAEGVALVVGGVRGQWTSAISIPATTSTPRWPPACTPSQIWRGDVSLVPGAAGRQRRGGRATPMRESAAAVDGQSTIAAIPRPALKSVLQAGLGALDHTVAECRIRSKPAPWRSTSPSPRNTNSAVMASSRSPGDTWKLLVSLRFCSGTLAV